MHTVLIYTVCFVIGGSFIGMDSCAAAENTSPEELVAPAQPFSFEVGGGRPFLLREPYLIIQEFRESAAPFLAGARQSFEPDGRGDSAEGRVTWRFDESLSLEAGFAGYWFDTTTDLSVLGGSVAGAANPSHTSLLPIIDGGNHGLRSQAVEIGGQAANPNARASVDFDYESREFDGRIDLLKRLLGGKTSRISGLVGFGYATFDQEATFATRGINFDNAGITRTFTSEVLEDQLFGFLYGAKAVLEIARVALVELEVIGGLYHRITDFAGHQDFENASHPYQGTPLTLAADITQSETSDAPRIFAEVRVFKKIIRDFEIGVFYSYDKWWNLSTVDNPTVSFAARAGGNSVVIDHPARIGTEDVEQHNFGIRVRW